MLLQLLALPAKAACAPVRCGEAGVDQTSPGCDACIPCENATLSATIPACKPCVAVCLEDRTWEKQPGASPCDGSAADCCPWRECIFEGLVSTKTLPMFARPNEECGASFAAWQLVTGVFGIFHFVTVLSLLVFTLCHHARKGNKAAPTATAPMLAGAETAASVLPPPAGGGGRRPRSAYLDNLKSFLTLVVILHHTACLFNGRGTNAGPDTGDGQGTSFYMVLSAPRPAEDTTDPFPQHMDWYILMDWFIATNQAYFMGFFFFISGIFTPSSFDRKGRRGFLLDRFKRLGIPWLCWCFVLSPMTMFLVQLRGGAPLVYEVAYPSGGPPWFIYMLLLMSIVYSFVPGSPWDQLQLLPHNVHPAIRNAVLVCGGLLLGVLEMLVEILFVDMGCEVRPDQGNDWTCYEAFDMPSPSQGLVWYPVFFALGVLCKRNDWLATLVAEQPPATTAVWSGIALVTSPINLASRFDPRALSRLRPLLSGLFCVSMCIAQLQLFHRYLNTAGGPGGLGSQVSAAAYTVYLIHPICLLSVGWLYTTVLAEYPLSSTTTLAGGLVFTSVVGSTLSWVLASQVRKFPGLRDVL